MNRKSLPGLGVGFPNCDDTFKSTGTQPARKSSKYKLDQAIPCIKPFSVFRMHFECNPLSAQWPAGFLQSCLPKYLLSVSTFPVSAADTPG